MLTFRSRSLVILLSVIQLSFAFELPFLGSCSIEDEKCHCKYTEKFFEMYGKGIPEIDVPTMDPMYLGNTTINGNSNENFNLKLKMYDFKLYNYPVVKCLSLKGFTKDTSKPMRFVLKIISPHLIMRSHWKINGKLLIFTVGGDTDVEIDVKNLTTTMSAIAEPYTKDNKVYFKARDLKSDITIGSLKMKFANSTLFNGEQIFMDTFADTINDNWMVLSEEIAPHLEATNARICQDILNKILVTMSYDRFFKD